VDRFVRGDAGLRESVADRMRGGQEFFERKTRKSLPRGEAGGGFGELASEVQREIENSGGWRSDCPTTQ
jgi:hypothetical protein